MLKITITLSLFFVSVYGQVSSDYWYSLFRNSDNERYPCLNGEGDYASPTYPDRFYTCAKEEGINAIIMKSERVCPPHRCYNSVLASKCSSCPASTVIPEDPYHPCVDVEGAKGHPKDPTLFYTCRTSAIGVIYYTIQQRCPVGTCFTNNNRRRCSSEACPPSPTITTTPATTNITGICSRKQSETAAKELLCIDETMDMLRRGLPASIQTTGHRGDQYQNFLKSLIDTHLDMRANYAKLIRDTGRNIFPVIVATECDTPELCGVGGTYKLFMRDGSMKRMPRVAPEFEAYKALAHLVLGVYSIIAPYFNAPFSSTWVDPLSVFLRKVRAAEHALDHTDRLNADERKLAAKMLELTEDYVEKAILNKSVDSEGYHRYSTAMAPMIDRCMQDASEMQAKHILPELKKWREELGPEEWRKVHVLITTIWPVSKINVRLQMFEEVMEFEQVRQQILIVEGGRDEDFAFNTLGRIVADRALGLLTFDGIDDPDMRDHAFSISTRRDLLSTQAGRAITKQCQKAPVQCPMRQTTSQQ